MRFQSKRTVIPIRGVGRYKFAKSGAERRGSAENLLRKARQVFGSLGQECKQMPDLRVFLSRRLQALDGGVLAHGPGCGLPSTPGRNVGSIDMAKILLKTVSRR